MELDELKTNWNVLNERLQQNEILNKKIIKEMIESRTKSAHNTLYRFDLAGVIVLVLGIVLLPLIRVPAGTFVLLEVCFGIALCLQLFQLSFLLRLDVATKSISELMRLTLQYKLWVKRISVFSMLALIPLLGSIVVLRHINMENVWNICIVSLAFLVALFFTFINLRFYNKNVITIIKGLEELKEFEKE